MFHIIYKAEKMAWGSVSSYKNVVNNVLLEQKLMLQAQRKLRHNEHTSVLEPGGSEDQSTATKRALQTTRESEKQTRVILQCRFSLCIFHRENGTFHPF